MSPLREVFREGHAFSLVQEGLGDDTRRAFGVPGRWRGLSGGDRALLIAYLDALESEISELHTDVPVGVVPADHGEWASDWHRERWLKIHPLRIDVVVLDAGGWMVLECKPDAGYVALGQLLTYGFWAGKCIRALRGCRLAVVTDRCQASIRPVYDQFEIGVYEYGDVV